jgi:hypothetical protein
VTAGLAMPRNSPLGGSVALATGKGTVMNLLDLVQWPAMVVTLAAGWAVGSRTRQRREVGFWLFIVSNVLWVVWGVSEHAWALIVLQVGLFMLNVRGARKNEQPAAEH